MLLLALLLPATSASDPGCAPAAAACKVTTGCHAYGVYGNRFQLHGCATKAALYPNLDWAIFVPTDASKSVFKLLGQKVNVNEAKCASHPMNNTEGLCHQPPPHWWGLGKVHPKGPKYIQTWDMAKSTGITICNNIGQVDAHWAARWGIVDIDWNSDKRNWSRPHPMDAEENVLKNA